jgi:PAS domain S-box-containing protein
MDEEQVNPLEFLTSDTFREIFQSASEGIIMVNPEGIIIMANPTSEKMFFYDVGELVGQSIENLLPESKRQAHVGMRHQFHKNPTPRRMGLGRDLTARRKDGSEFPVEISLSHKKIEKEMLVMAFIIDITERKKAEEAVRQSEEQLLIYAGELERKVLLRTEELNKSITDLEREVRERKKAEEDAHKALEKERELNELKSKFVSIASHEFRTPLSTILSSASLIGQYTAKGQSEKTVKHVSRIKSSVNHLTGILNDFLSLGKLEEGKIDVIPEPINVPVFLQEIQEEMWPLLKEDQKIITQFEGNPLPFISDLRILRNILFNLLSNASKYSNPEKIIKLIVTYFPKSLSIAVIDQGIGIPETERKHLFDRFFRASNATNIQGSGLGLNIVKKYIDLLNGTIHFTTQEGKGSTFTITLPYTYEKNTSY